MRDKTESRIQQEIVIYFNNNYCLKHHKPRCSIFSVPNEGVMQLGNILRMRFKQINFEDIIKKILFGLISTGLKKGVSDLIVLMPKRVIFVEVKTPTGSQSPDQKEFESLVKNLGFEYYLIRSLQDFKTYCTT